MASLLLLGPWPRPARAQLLGSEFQVNTYTQSFQVNPAVAADALGNFVVVWQSYAQDGIGYGVFGQRFDSTGSKLGSEFQVNTFVAENQRYPAVAADGPGNFVVVWQSQLLDGDGYGVFGQRYDPAGGAVGSEFQVNTYGTYDQRYPAVAADGSGNFVVAWRSPGGDDADGGVFAHRFDPAGAPVGSEFRVNTFTTNAQAAPAVAADDSGNFVVVWASAGQDGSGSGVFGQRYDSVGDPAGSEFLVNTFTTGDQRFPTVATDGSGNFVVAWDSSAQDGSDYGVFGQRFDSAGNGVGSEFRVNTWTTSVQRFPSVAADGSGDFVVVWESSGQGEPDYSVFGQRFNSAGDRVGSEFLINTFTTSSQTSVAVASLRSGNFVATWDSGHDESGDGVFGQRLTIPLLSDGFELGNVCAWSDAVGDGDSCP